MRIAFLTPEFVTEYGFGGGLGNYLNRFAGLLAERGHEVEVFVPSDAAPGVVQTAPFRVERTPRRPGRLAHALLRRVAASVRRQDVYALAVQSWMLSRALERRHAQAPFEVVQSADYLAAGLFVPRRAGRVHVTRCSSAADLWNGADGVSGAREERREALERRAIARADKRYAPSRFVAEHLAEAHGLSVGVVRPPVALEVAPAANPPAGLPSRFLVHFGQLCLKKGSDRVARALPLAWKQAPDLRMVWVGVGDFAQVNGWLQGLGEDRWKVQALYPLPKPELYALLRQAAAAVLPSRVDNIPNTALECLQLGVPVIATRGASFDEIVRDGLDGELTPDGDDQALADAMVRAWNAPAVARTAFADSPLLADFSPDRAVARFIDYVSG